MRPAKTSIPNALESIVAYAEPAIPNAGRPKSPLISVGLRMILTMLMATITYIGVFESPLA